MDYLKLADLVGAVDPKVYAVIPGKSELLVFSLDVATQLLEDLFPLVLDELWAEERQEVLHDFAHSHVLGAPFRCPSELPGQLEVIDFVKEGNEFLAHI